MNPKDNRLLVRKLMPVILLALLFMGVSTLPAHAQTTPEKSTPAYSNPALPLEKRVDDLVSRMTLDEKVRQMQHVAPSIPRLNVPSYDWWSEALHGVARSGYATVFPQAIGMAATFDYGLIHREGQTIAIEGRAKYNQAQREHNHGIYFGLDFWSPNVNIFRDPRWGRGQETLGEDPFLTGKLGVAFVTGLQGDNPKYFETIATPKHYAVHSGPESLRHKFDVSPSQHDLEDTYLPAFRATVVEGHADSVMCAYNAIFGAPACASKFLLQDTLRDAWKFNGYVTSDCGAVGDISEGHKYAPDNEHGAAAAVLAGTDTTCGDEYVDLVKAVQDGVIKESKIDVSLKRLFTARFRLGMFDPPSAVSFNQIPFSENNSLAHRELALHAARESMVLLENQDGFLPLKAKYQTLAVIGPNAESVVALEGNYQGTPYHPVLPVDGMRKVFAGQAKIVYAQGSPYVEQLPVPVPSTVFQGADAGEKGLKGEYFSNPKFSGTPVLTRRDAQIQFDWDTAAPLPNLSRKSYSVRWTGTFTPPGPGDYTFSVPKPEWHPGAEKETIRVYLDGQAVLDTTMAAPGTWQPQEHEPKTTFEESFADVKSHAFRMEYSHSSDVGAGDVRLLWKPPVALLRDEAVKTAQAADAIVAFVGLSPELEGEEMPIEVPGFQGGDRTDIGLPAAQQQLLEALAATGKPLVVVLMNGSALAVNLAREHAKAVVEAWYPGVEGGTAIAETLSGANNPAGRLPITFYASLDQLPPFEDYSMQNRTYRYFQGRPLYGFGFGLSYSRFEYSNLKLSSAELKAGSELTVGVDVKNTSSVAGDEVAELYLEFPALPGAPARALRGFERVHVAPLATRHVTFTLKPRDLSMVNDQGEHVIAPGQYTVFVGGAQPGETQASASAKLTISGEEKLPR